jgi:hypothetical protein
MGSSTIMSVKLRRRKAGEPKSSDSMHKPKRSRQFVGKIFCFSRGELLKRGLGSGRGFGANLAIATATFMKKKEVTSLANEKRVS